MIKLIYSIILFYFLIGGMGFYLINRKKPKDIARKSYTKFITYFFIINLLFFSIVIKPVLFQVLVIAIIVIGLFELIKLFSQSQFLKKGFFVFSLVAYLSLSVGFYFFSTLYKELILFSFLILSIFDSFSQISGQLWGKTKILPEISPKKTLGGLVGGAIIAIASGLLLQGLYEGTSVKAMVLAAGIVLFAFIGDLAASFYKRKYGVKDFSNLIPGHGGFLDRFDSLITGGAWVAASVYILNF